MKESVAERYAETKLSLQKYYENLVKLEISDPEKFHKVSYLGIKRSKHEEIQKEIEDAPCVDTIGQVGIFDDGIPFYHYRRAAFTKEGNRRLAEFGVKLKQSRFDPTEDRQIKRNWKSYCKLTNLFDPSEASEVFCDGQKRGKRVAKDPYFYAYLCRGLVDRTCAQVVRRVYILFNKAQEAGDDREWTESEDIMLKKLAKKHNNKWATIGRKLNRTRFTCYHRYTKLQKDEKVKSCCLTATEDNNGLNIENDHSENENLKTKSTSRSRYCKNTNSLITVLEELLKAEEESLRDKIKIVKFREWFTKRHALTEYDEAKKNLMCRQLQDVLKLCEAYRLFECLPIEHCNCYSKLEFVHYFLTNKKDKGSRTAKAMEDLFLKYVDDKTWTPRNRVLLCHKLDITPDKENTESGQIKKIQDASKERHLLDEDQNGYEENQIEKEENQDKENGEQVEEGQEEAQVENSDNEQRKNKNSKRKRSKTKEKREKKQEEEQLSQENEAQQTDKLPKVSENQRRINSKRIKPQKETQENREGPFEENRENHVEELHRELVEELHHESPEGPKNEKGTRKRSKTQTKKQENNVERPESNEEPTNKKKNKKEKQKEPEEERQVDEETQEKADDCLIIKTEQEIEFDTQPTYSSYNNSNYDQEGYNDSYSSPSSKSRGKNKSTRASNTNGNQRGDQRYTSDNEEEEIDPDSIIRNLLSMLKDNNVSCENKNKKRASNDRGGNTKRRYNNSTKR